MTKKITLVFVLAVLVRIILMAISYHSDIAAIDFSGFAIAQGHLLNIYDYLINLPPDSYILKSYPNYLFNYPPAVYFVFGSLAALFSNLVSSSFWQGFLFNISSVLSDPVFKLHMITLKLPYMAFDLAAAFLFMKLFADNKKTLAFVLWLFNPVNLYATYLVGQFDVAPTFFVIASMVAALKFKEEKNSLPLLGSALLLGLGAAFKIYPFFLIVPLASLSSKWSTRIKVMILGLLPYLVTVLPFFASKGYRYSALVANQTLKSLYPQIAVSGGEAIMLFLAALLFAYFVFLQGDFKKWLWEKYLITLIIFFIFTHYHPQWFLWLSPFLIWSLLESNYKTWLPIAAAIFSWFSLIFFFDSGLSLGLFAPLSPNLYNSATIWQLLHISPDYNFFRSLLQTVFVGSGAYLIYYYGFKSNLKSV